MKKMLCIIFLLFTQAFVSKIVVAEPTVKLKINYYDISGRTASEIRKNLDRKSPVRVSGASYDAHTKWYVRWNYRWNKSEELCTIVRVDVSVDVQMMMPKLKISNSFPEALAKKWDAYIQALLRHENGHKDIGVRAAKKIENKILNMPSQRTCKQLEINANDIGNKIIKDFSVIEKTYDRKSNHGMNDGAVFP